MKFSPLKNKKVSDFSNNKYYIIKKRNDFTIIKYNKKNLTIDNENSVGLFRSVIMNDDNIVAFAPQKSVNYNNFIAQHEFNDCYITEYVDGTMINIFYNNKKLDENGETTPGWEFCTRSNIGAKCRYNLDTQKTFYDMFLDACIEEKLDFNILNKECCYSFVLQHPDNKIVKHIEKPKLILTRVYSFNSENEIFDVTEEEKNIDIDTPRTLYNINKNVSNWLDFTELCSGENLPFDEVGFVIYNKEGVRTKIRNIAYEKVKRLKGNLQKMFLQYLTLRKSGQLRNFLRYFPEYKDNFELYKQKLYKWTYQLFDHYVDTFILKKKRLKECPFEFKPILYNIQKEYLEMLKPNNKKITFKYLTGYVHDCIPPKKLMFCINYPLRKKLLKKV
uniref:T4 RNA ligase 1-like N-terminal domain-containing protein n=1 Tax=viral metagenome TaxID=1070528 RepID=A0A6C0F8X2_9ZZZZ|tara:strand:- start:3031 stop:4197 length:1167 start_codon:yes stop_codon:yes gene_type:complete